MANQAEDTTTSAAKKAHDAIDKAENAAKEAKHTAQQTRERVEETVEKGADWVKENPAKALLGAAAIGWVAAKLFGRKK